jgi:hypothetical protein
MPNLPEICSRLAADSDARVQEIGRRCLRNYDEFQMLRYASLTNGDAQHLTESALVARGLGDTKRAKLLEQGAKALGSELTRLRPAPKKPAKTTGKAAAQKVAQA